MAKQQKQDHEDLHKFHRERMRQRLMAMSPLEDHEKIEVLLFYIQRRRNTNETAHRLLRTFKDIPGLFRASKEELCQVKGVGPAIADFLLETGEVLRELHVCKKTPIPLILTAEDIYQAVISRLHEDTSPRYCVFFLQENGALLSYAAFPPDVPPPCRDLCIRYFSCEAEKMVIVRWDAAGEPEEAETGYIPFQNLCRSLNDLGCIVQDVYIHAPGQDQLTSLRARGVLLGILPD